ncbi:MAG TPA: DUF6585 family protein [Polyangiaceae bacterium]|nr:DUF6585 family protein [Polyangiaceae bacterium]
MGGAPYRSPTAPPPGGAAGPPDPLARLGSLRSSHRPPPLRRSLAMPVFAAALVAALVGGVGVAAKAPSAGPSGLAAAAGALAFLILGWGALRDRATSIDLHAQGLVLTRGGARAVVPFDDVDQVWFDLERSSSYVGVIARIVGLKLVDRAGAATLVPLAPLDAGDANAVVRWVHRHCSVPLLDEARKALREGEALTFGHVTVDAEGVGVGGARAAWRELRLVRLQPGRVAFFRRLPLVPWRTVDWAHIPHPTVFVRLVTELAHHIELDNPIGVEDDA